MKITSELRYLSGSDCLCGKFMHPTPCESCKQAIDLIKEHGAAIADALELLRLSQAIRKDNPKALKRMPLHYLKYFEQIDATLGNLGIGMSNVLANPNN